jgi:hypothetical protein
VILEELFDLLRLYYLIDNDLDRIISKTANIEKVAIITKAAREAKIDVSKHIKQIR